MRQINSDSQVLYVGGFNFIKNTASSIRVIENAMFFEKLGIKTTVLGKIDTTDSFSSINIKGIDVFNINYKDQTQYDFTTNIESIKKYIEVLSKQQNKKIIIIAYNYPPIALQKLLRFSRKSSVSLVQDITEWHGIDGTLTFEKMLRWLLIQWKFRVLTPKTEHIILASDYLANRFSKQNKMLLPFVTIENTNLNKHCTDFNVINKRTFIYAGSPGNDFSKDRLDFLLQTLQGVKKLNENFIFRIVGLEKKEIENIDKVKEAILDLGENLQFYGRLPNDETVALIKTSDFVLFARDINKVTSVGFPTKVFEAFKCGTPVITNATSNLNQYINSSNGFLVKSLDLELFKKTILEAISLNLDEIQQLKKNCINNNPFYYENFKNEFIAFFNQINTQD